MSLKNFSKLFFDLDNNNSTNRKIEILQTYFRSNESLENAWTIYLLTGKKNKRFASGKYIKKSFSDIYQFPLWLIDSCYSKVGDSAEVITLLLKNENTIYLSKSNPFGKIIKKNKSDPRVLVLKKYINTKIKKGQNNTYEYGSFVKF